MVTLAESAYYSDPKRCLQVCQEMASFQREQNGIGTLGEKTLHAVLKKYYEPDVKKHEVLVGRYVADIFTGTEIVEIQTRQLGKLRKKLSVFLEKYPVTVVHPIIGKKWVYWVNPENGECSKGRVSPKHGNVFDAFYELYQIKPFLVGKGMTLRIPIVSVQEYKYLNGWSRDKKRGATWIDRIPVEMEKEIVLRTVEDYAKLIPDKLDREFTCKEFAQYAGISAERAQNVVPILYFVGSLCRVGKRGRAYIYVRNQEFL